MEVCGASKLYDQVSDVIHLFPVRQFYTPENIRKRQGSLAFSGATEIQQEEMG